MKELTYQMAPMTAADISFVIQILTSPRNKSALNPADLSLAEWQTKFEQNLADPDEANFIIRQGETPIAWIKLNGLSGSDMAWISMLTVHENYQRQGVGSFAIHHAEKYVLERGFTAVGIHANVENAPAVNCYKNAGYGIIEENDCTNGDGSRHRGYTFYKDHLDCVRIRMSIDGLPFFMGKPFDFSFLKKYGTVFKVFDEQDSGNICFGIEKDGKRYFVKFAGAPTVCYKGSAIDAINRLKPIAPTYTELAHPTLIKFLFAEEIGGGFAAVFEWTEAVGIGRMYPQNHRRFCALPLEKRMSVYDKILAFHKHVAQRGYVAIDFYDGTIMYDFETEKTIICDVDFYQKSPYYGELGIWGSSKFVSPEECKIGGQMDEITTVYTMGATAFALFAKFDRSFEAWSANKALFDVATKAVSDERSERYQSLEELIAAWEQAKGVYTIEYKRLHLSDLTPDLLKSFHRYQEIKKSWRKIDGEWVLIDNPFIADWTDEQKRYTVSAGLIPAVTSGGAVFAAYDADKVIGFSSLMGERIGLAAEYLQMDMLHVSAEYRHHGIGKTLFHLAVEAARELGAPKMYISASSSVESQAFYRAMGCVEAEETIPELYDDSYDVHMEFAL
jgi:ribosomal protein S18 acetylase RimI-like enzyme